MQQRRTDGKKISYNCESTARYGNKICWSIKADAIDAAVVEAALTILNEKQLNLALSVLDYHESEIKERNNCWQQEIEAAYKEVQLAKKRYKLANPEYREIVEQLEKEWHDAIQTHKKIEQNYHQFQNEQQQMLSQEEKDSILSLAQDLPVLWRNSATTMQERKKLLRLLIDSVVIAPIDEPELLTHIKVLWHTGTITEFFVERKPSFVLYKTPEAVVKAIEELLDLSDSEIATKLNERGLVSGKGSAFNANKVGAIRFDNKLTKIKGLDGIVLQTIKELLHLPDHQIVEELNRRGFVTSRGRAFTTASLMNIRVKNKLYKEKT
jgi:hypothetical protein